MKDKKNAKRWFIQGESLGGALLFIATICALAFANSPWREGYQSLQLPLSHVVNDGLMTLFFLLIGLEIRREVAEGELNTRAKAMLPALAALGGMVVPALIYLVVNPRDPVAQRGFGVPVATDIAFTLALLAVLGRRVPVSIKAFLTALAIFDDMGAIVLIAVFYNVGFSWTALGLAFLVLIVMSVMKVARIQSVGLIVILGAILWYCTLKSGLHPTLAGVVLAFVVPTAWEHKLYPVVTYFIMPLFGFLNAGVYLMDVNLAEATTPVAMGIVAGLFFGKQIGIFVITWLAVQLRIAPKPNGASWLSIYGASIVCGIGFTMSLFMGALAFLEPYPALMLDVKIGVMVGSLASGLLGALVLALAARRA